MNGAPRKRIALLANYPADHTSFDGGVETATASLLEGLRPYQDRYEFHVISVPQGLAADVVEERDGFSFHFLSVPRRSWQRPRLPFRVRKAHRELLRIDPHLVHCQDNMALAVAASFTRYPRLFTIHGVKRDEADKRTGWERWSARADALLERYVYRRFDAFVCISRYAERVVGAGRTTFAIPNAVSARFFEVAPGEDGAAPPYLLYAGVLAPLKRPADLLVAHVELRRQYPRLETLLCGSVEDAGYAATMERTIAEQQIEGIRFMGRVGRPELARLMAQAVALVLPSAQENAPMVIAEAMAAGTPVVATCVGGVPDMVRDGETGLLFRPGDVGTLVAHLRGLLEYPERRQELGRRAREAACSAYSAAGVGTATIAAYETLLAGSAHG